MNTLALAQMIGSPFKDKGRDLSGFDCWGAVQWGLQVGFGVIVPSYAEEYASSQEKEEVAAFIGRHSMEWPEVPLLQAQGGDVILLRIFGQPWHIGLIIDPPTFLHADRKAGIVIERWDSLIWQTRIVAVHRHPARTYQ